MFEAVADAHMRRFIPPHTQRLVDLSPTVSQHQTDLTDYLHNCVQLFFYALSTFSKSYLAICRNKQC